MLIHPTARANSPRVEEFAPRALCVGAEEARGSHRRAPLVRGSDGEGKVGEGDCEPMVRIEFDGEF